MCCNSLQLLDVSSDLLPLPKDFCPRLWSPASTNSSGIKVPLSRNLDPPLVLVKAFTVLRSASPKRCFAMLKCSIWRFTCWSALTCFNTELWCRLQICFQMLSVYSMTILKMYEVGHPRDTSTWDMPRLTHPGDKRGEPDKATEVYRILLGYSTDFNSIQRAGTWSVDSTEAARTTHSKQLSTEHQWREIIDIIRRYTNIPLTSPYKCVSRQLMQLQIIMGVTTWSQVGKNVQCKRMHI